MRATKQYIFTLLGKRCTLCTVHGFVMIIVPLRKIEFPLHFPMIVWHACMRAFILTSGSIRDDQTGTIISQHLDPVLNFENPVQDQL